MSCPGLLIENQIFSCASANVRIDDEAEPILKKNDIHGGRAEGVSVMSNGLGRLEHNNIHSNSASGVVILSGTIAIRTLQIHNVRSVLIHDADIADPRFEPRFASSALKLPCCMHARGAVRD